MNARLDLEKMAEAARLTRAGRLSEAAELVQRTLRGTANPASVVSNGTAQASDGPEIGSQPSGASTENGAPQPAFSKPTATARDLASGLSGLIDRAKRLGPGLGLHAPRPAPSARHIVPEGGRFIEASYANAAGSLTYKVYIPSGYRGQPVPLVVMLHGCTQSADDFAAGTRMNLIAEEQTCLVVYPEQSAQANASKCWNWFRSGDQHRDHGEPSLIAGITRQVMREYAVDPQRVYVGGLSAGAAAAAVMGETYPDLYAAICVHSGLACGAASDLPSAFAAMRQGQPPSADARTVSAMAEQKSIPIIVFHGDRDTTVHPCNGEQIIERSKRAANLHTEVHHGQVPGGHSYTRTLYSDGSGRAAVEQWEIHGAGHAWSGGSSAGSYTDPRGPDATREMLRFFLQHANAAAR